MKEASYGFLYNYDSVKTLSEKDLQRCCKNLNATMHDDVDCINLFIKIKIFALQNVNITNITIFILKLSYCPKNYINFTNQRSICRKVFFQIKIIKNYLRSNIGQERITSLTILSIERELVNKLCWCYKTCKIKTTYKCNELLYCSEKFVWRPRKKSSLHQAPLLSGPALLKYSLNCCSFIF